MRGVSDVATRILGAVTANPDCMIEDVVQACPDLTEDQVLLEIDRLRGAGQVILTLHGSGRYTLRTRWMRSAMPSPAIYSEQPVRSSVRLDRMAVQFARR